MKVGKSNSHQQNKLGLGEDRISVSPATKFLVFAIFIGVVLTFLLSLIGIPFGFGYSRALFVIMIAILLYALLTRIAGKLRRVRCGK